MTKAPVCCCGALHGCKPVDMQAPLLHTKGCRPSVDLCFINPGGASATNTCAPHPFAPITLFHSLTPADRAATSCWRMVIAAGARTHCDSVTGCTDGRLFRGHQQLSGALPRLFCLMTLQASMRQLLLHGLN